MNKAASSAIASPPTSPRRTNNTKATGPSMATLKTQPNTVLDRLQAPPPDSSVLRQVQCRAHAYVRLMERLVGHALPGLFKWILIILLLGPAMATTVAARLAAFGFASPEVQKRKAVEEIDSTTAQEDEQAQLETTRLDLVRAHQGERTQLLTALQQNAKAAETSGRALVEKELALAALQQALASARDVAEGQEATLRSTLAQLENEHAGKVKEIEASHAEITKELQRDTVRFKEEHAQALSTLQIEKTRLQQALQDMSGKRESLEAERESLKHDNATLQNEIISTKQQLQDALAFKDKATAAETNVRSLRESHEVLQTEINQLKQQLHEAAEFREKAATLQAQHQSLSQAHDALQKEKAVVSQRYSQAEELVAASKIDNKQLSHNLSKLSTELTERIQAHEALQQRVNALEGDNQAQLSQAETLANQVRDVQARLAKEKEAHAEQLTQSDTLQKLAEERQVALNASVEKQKVTEAELAKRTDDWNALQRTLLDAQNKIAEGEHQVQTYMTQLAQKQATIEKQEKELAAYELTKKELAGFRAQVDSQTIAFKKSRLDAEQLQEEVQKLQKELGQAQEKTRSLHAEHEHVAQKGNKLEQLVSELKNKLTRHQALETQHNQLQQEHATAKEALRSTTQQTSDLQRQIGQTQDNAVAAQKQAETLLDEAERRLQKERQELSKAHEHAEKLVAQLKEAEVKTAKAQEDMHSTLSKANTEKEDFLQQLATTKEEAIRREGKTASEQKVLQEQLAHFREQASAHESAEEGRAQIEEELSATKQQLVKARAQMDNLRAQLAKAIETKQVKAAIQRSASTSISDATAVEPALAPAADLEAASRPLSNSNGLGHARQSSIPRLSGHGGTPPSTRGSGSIPGSPSMSSRSRPGSSRYEQVVDAYVDIHKMKRSHDAEKQELLQQIGKLQASAPQDAAATSQVAASGASERSASTLDKGKSKPGVLKRSSTLKSLFGKDRKK